MKFSELMPYRYVMVSDKGPEVVADESCQQSRLRTDNLRWQNRYFNKVKRERQHAIVHKKTNTANNKKTYLIVANQFIITGN